MAATPATKAIEAPLIHSTLFSINGNQADRYRGGNLDTRPGQPRPLPGRGGPRLIEGEPVAVAGTKATEKARYRHRSAMKR
jgi:hypothetical protein